MKQSSTIEHIELLKQYYEYDELTHVFTIPISYDKAEDLLDLDVRDPKEHPRFKKDVMNNVKDILMSLPAGTKANIRLRVKDYQGYDPDTLLNAFNEGISLNQYRSRLEQKRSAIEASVFAIIGALVLFFYITGKVNGWFGEDDGSASYEFITEVLDIVAWVFIWEAVSVAFLYGDDYRSINAGLFMRINVIGFYDESGEKMLSKEELQGVVKSTSTARKWELLGRNMVLVGSLAMLLYGGFIAINSLIGLIEVIAIADWSVNMVLIIGIAVGALFFLLGLGGLFIYTEKPYLRRFCFIMTITLAVLMVLYLVSALISNTGEYISSMALSILVYLTFAVGYFLCWFFSKPKKEAKKEESKE